MPSQQPIRFYRFAFSGHSHKVELLLSLLQLPVEKIDIDLLRDEHKSASFLALNPLGQVPVIEDGDTVVSDSNAILVYLAERYGAPHWLVPDAPVGSMQRFLSLAAGELAFGPAVLRRQALFGGAQDNKAQAWALSERLCGFLEQHLAGRSYFLGSLPSIADVSCYTYLAHAPEGGFSLASYPRLQAWIARMEALDGFIPMAKVPARSTHEHSTP